MVVAIREQLPLASSVSRLRHLAQLAETSGNSDLEWTILEKIMVAGGDRPEVRRRLGTLAFQKHNMIEAGDGISSAFVAATGGDYETLMLLGNIALRKRESDDALKYFAKSFGSSESIGGQVNPCQDR